MALLDWPDAGASRRRRRCRFELVEGVGVIVLVVVLVRSVDPLYAKDKSRVAIYGIKVIVVEAKGTVAPPCRRQAKKTYCKSRTGRILTRVEYTSEVAEITAGY